jgi:nitrogen regulatory protein PII
VPFLINANIARVKSRAQEERMNDEVSDDAAQGDDLWMVQAVIQPFKLDQVTRALEGIEGFSGMTVTNVRGFGHGKLTDRAAHAEAHRRHEDLDDFTGKLQIVAVVASRRFADDATAVIASAAHTGNRGDGKIFVWPLSRAVRVRTMEEGADAL